MRADQDQAVPAFGRRRFELGALMLGDLPNNNSGTDAVTLKDGRHLVVYNHATGTPGEWGGPRTPLNLAVSSDAKHWDAVLVLENEPGEYSYPAIIQAADGRVHITCTRKRQSLKHIVLDPENRARAVWRRDVRRIEPGVAHWVVRRRYSPGEMPVI